MNIEAANQARLADDLKNEAYAKYLESINAPKLPLVKKNKEVAWS